MIVPVVLAEAALEVVHPEKKKESDQSQNPLVAKGHRVVRLQIIL